MMVVIKIIQSDGSLIEVRKSLHLKHVKHKPFNGILIIFLFENYNIYDIRMILKLGRNICVCVYIYIYVYLFYI